MMQGSFCCDFSFGKKKKASSGEGAFFFVLLWGVSAPCTVGKAAGGADCAVDLS